MGWCSKHHCSLFVITHNKPWPVTTSALLNVLSPYRDVESIARFWTIRNFHAHVNFYYLRDYVNAFHKLQRHRIREYCSEMDLYFASELIFPYVVIDPTSLTLRWTIKTY